MGNLNQTKETGTYELLDKPKSFSYDFTSPFGHLWTSGFIKHPECIERIVAELNDGREVDVGRPDIVAYKIIYKKGPCKEECKELLPEIQKRGCYNGEITRIEIKDLL